MHVTGSDADKGYYVSPSAEQLAGMDAQELQRVPNFTVGRTDYGSIRWLDPTDIRSLPLGELVSIEDNEVR